MKSSSIHTHTNKLIVENSHGIIPVIFFKWAEFFFLWKNNKTNNYIQVENKKNILIK